MKTKATPDAVVRDALADLFDRDAEELAAPHPEFAAELKGQAKALRVESILLTALEITKPRRTKSRLP